MISEMTTVYDGDAAELVQGIAGEGFCVAVNMEDVKRLGSWLCCNSCGRPGTEVKAEKERNGGYCDVCGNQAAFLIVVCPYIDMSRPDERFL